MFSVNRSKYADRAR